MLVIVPLDGGVFYERVRRRATVRPEPTYLVGVAAFGALAPASTGTRFLVFFFAL